MARREHAGGKVRGNGVGGGRKRRQVHMNCFNCERTEGVKPFSFDMDLPTLYGCDMCTLALSVGDWDMLDDLKPRKARRAKKPAKA